MCKVTLSKVNVKGFLFSYRDESFLRPFVIIGSVHVDQYSRVVAGNIYGCCFKSVQQCPQSARFCKGENGRNQHCRNERRMASLLAMAGTADIHVTVVMSLLKFDDSRGKDKRHVGGEEEEGLTFFGEVLHTGLDGGKHALVVAVVDCPADAMFFQKGCDNFRLMPNDNKNIGNACLPEKTDDFFDNCLTAQRQQGFKKTHTGGTASGKNDSGDFFI